MHKVVMALIIPISLERPGRSSIHLVMGGKWREKKLKASDYVTVQKSDFCFMIDDHG